MLRMLGSVVVESSEGRPVRILALSESDADWDEETERERSERVLRTLLGEKDELDRAWEDAFGTAQN